MLRVIGGRARSADLVIRDADKAVVVAAEFKYEPSHRRAELLPAKLPVVFWGTDGVAKDINRIREFVDRGAARAAFAVFIDEGGYFRYRPAHPGTEWRDWPTSHPGGHEVSVLWACWPAKLTSEAGREPLLPSSSVKTFLG